MIATGNIRSLKRRSIFWLMLLVIVALAAPSSGAIQASATTKGQAASNGYYQNAVSPPAAQSFGSPSLIRGRDGYWYAFGAGNPLNPGDPGSNQRPDFPILRSHNLVDWQYVGDVFPNGTDPQWAVSENGSRHGRWAPSIEFFNGQYYLYYAVTGVPGYPLPNRAIGVATAPTPVGPWTDSGAPLLAPEYWTPIPGTRERPRSIIDPDVLTAPDGTRYLYYGGYQGGIYVVRLAPDGLSTDGDPVQLTAPFAYEGPYVVHRDGWYYLFASYPACCSGPVSGYSVNVGRSRSPLGPFIDRYGVSMLDNSHGGMPVLAANGNKWVGTGHNAMVTDLSGQDYFEFNGIDRNNPYLALDDSRRGENRRPMLIDRLDWIDGWPTVRAGKWASAEPVPAPRTDARVLDAFENGDALGAMWKSGSGWSVGHEPAGGYAHSDVRNGRSILESSRALNGNVRVRGAVRLGDGDIGSAGFVLSHHDSADGIRVVLDRSQGALVVEVRKNNETVSREASSLQEGFDYTNWHELDLSYRGHQITAQVSDSGLYDPVARVTTAVPNGLAAGHMGLIAENTPADFDDVTAVRLYTPVTEKVPFPTVGPVNPAYSDEFNGDLDQGWTWVREPAAQVQDGALVFPIQSGEMSGQSNSASLLVRDVPEGEWTVETKVTIPFGDTQVNRFPQAGLIVYSGDNDYLRFTVRAHGLVRDTSYQKEMTWTDGRPLRNAGTVGPPAETTWLRLTHRIDPVNGEHEFQASSSQDGIHWTWGMVYTLPSDAKFRIGVVAHGGNEPIPARFDYVRMHQP